MHFENDFSLAINLTLIFQQIFTLLYDNRKQTFIYSIIATKTIKLILLQILSRCVCFFQRILAISCFFLFSRLFEFLMKYLIHSGRVAVHENIANRIAVAYTATNELLI